MKRSQNIWAAVLILIVVGGFLWYLSSISMSNSGQGTATTTPSSPGASSAPKKPASSSKPAAAPAKVISATIDPSSLSTTGQSINIKGTAQSAPSVYLSIWRLSSDLTTATSEVTGLSLPVVKGAWSHEMALSSGGYEARIYLDNSRATLLASRIFLVP